MYSFRRERYKNVKYRNSPYYKGSLLEGCDSAQGEAAGRVMARGPPECDERMFYDGYLISWQNLDIIKRKDHRNMLSIS